MGACVGSAAPHTKLIRLKQSLQPARESCLGQRDPKNMEDAFTAMKTIINARMKVGRNNPEQTQARSRNILSKHTNSPSKRINSPHWESEGRIKMSRPIASEFLLRPTLFESSDRESSWQQEADAVELRKGEREELAFICGLIGGEETPAYIREERRESGEDIWEDDSSFVGRMEVGHAPKTRLHCYLQTI